MVVHGQEAAVVRVKQEAASRGVWHVRECLEVSEFSCVKQCHDL